MKRLCVWTVQRAFARTKREYEYKAQNWKHFGEKFQFFVLAFAAFFLSEQGILGILEHTTEHNFEKVTLQQRFKQQTSDVHKMKQQLRCGIIGIFLVVARLSRAGKGKNTL